MLQRVAGLSCEWASDVPTFSAACGSTSFALITLLCGPPSCRDEQGFALADDNPPCRNTNGQRAGRFPRVQLAVSNSDLPNICADVNAEAVSCCSLTTTYLSQIAIQHVLGAGGWGVYHPCISTYLPIQAASPQEKPRQSRNLKVRPPASCPYIYGAVPPGHPTS